MARMVRVRIPSLFCRRCGHHWRPRQPEVTICPRCKSRHWAEPRKNRQGLRTDLEVHDARKLRRGQS